MRIARSLTVALGAALAVSACGSSSGSGASNTEAAPSTVQDGTVETPAEVEAVYVPLASGEQLDFNSLRGQDVLLWFWAPW